MADLIVVLKSEIRRLARREARALTAHAQRQVAHHRRGIAELKRLLHEQGRRIALLEATTQKTPGVVTGSRGDVPAGARFSARSVKAQRKRLKLSAEQYGKLLGVSGQTVYSWEQKQSRPRKSQLAAWYASRQLSRSEAVARLGLGVAKKAPRRAPKKRAAKRKSR